MKKLLLKIHKALGNISKDYRVYYYQKRRAWLWSLFSFFRTFWICPIGQYRNDFGQMNQRMVVVFSLPPEFESWQHTEMFISEMQKIAPCAISFDLAKKRSVIEIKISDLDGGGTTKTL